MEKKNISVITLSVLLFLTVFGISNVPNNYSALGNSAIGWFVLLGIYFIPLALIIAELAAATTESTSGMFGWIKLGLGEKWAFLGTWSYFIANIFYIPMLASRIPIMLSWTFSADITSLDQVVSSGGQIDGVINATSNQTMFLFMALAGVLIATVLSIYFDKIFEKLGKIIGWLSLGITALFIVLALLAVPVFGLDIANPITVENSLPVVDATSLSTFAWILFAIAGIETIGSYVGVTKDAKSKIPRSIILAAVIIVGAYIVGFISMAFILTPEQVPVDSMENMTQIMYAQVYSLWGFGPLMLRITMFIYSLITITALVLWLTSTLTAVFTDFPSGIISEKIMKKEINNIPVLGIIFTTVMIIMFLIISNSATNSNIYVTLYDMSTIAVIVPYLLIVLSYIKFRNSEDSNALNLIKNKTVSLVLSVLIFIVTLIAIVFSCYDLSITDTAERTAWFITSFGGVVFFMIIGYGIYLLKENIHIAFVMFYIIFALSIIAFSWVFVFGLIISIIIHVLMIMNLKNN